MRKIKSKKGQSSNYDFLIMLLVSLIALALILSIIFRVNIVNWMRSLPDLGSPDEDKIINLGDDKIINNVSLCEKVGNLVPVSRGGGIFSGAGVLIKDIFSEPALYYISINGTRTELYVYQYKELTIELDEKINEKVGNIVPKTDTYLINIDDEWINDAGLRAKHPGIPSVNDMKSIDDAYLDKGEVLKICKKVELKK